MFEVVNIVSPKVNGKLTCYRAPPCPAGMDANSITQLRKSLVSFTFRIQSRIAKTWVVEVLELIVFP